MELARRIQNGALPTSWFARLEADHFTIVMPGVSAGDQVARRTEQRMAEVFGVPFELGETKLRLAARAGIALGARIVPNRLHVRALRRLQDPGQRLDLALQQTPHRRRDDLRRARELAGATFDPNVAPLPEPFNRLDFDAYRDIRFRPDSTPCR